MDPNDDKEWWTLDRLVGVFQGWGKQAVIRVLKGAKRWGVPDDRGIWTDGDKKG